MSRVISVAAAVLSLGIALALSACATAYDGAQQARGAISRAIDESTQAWVNYDKAKQAKIASDAPTKEAAHAALEAYRNGEQAKIIKAINGSWAALVGLDKALALYNAGSKDGLSAALAVAYGSLSDVAQALTLLGVPIPKVGN
jgi:hypothetical protein